MELKCTSRQFSVVLCRCETGSVTLRGERKLKVSESRMLRRSLRPKREKVTEGWKTLLHNALLDWGSSPHTRIDIAVISRETKWVGPVTRTGEQCVEISGGETTRKETICHSFVHRHRN
jgi:hypothetical protein